MFGKLEVIKFDKVWNISKSMALLGHRRIPMSMMLTRLCVHTCTHAYSLVSVIDCGNSTESDIWELLALDQLMTIIVLSSI